MLLVFIEPDGNPVSGLNTKQPIISALIYFSLSIIDAFGVLNYLECFIFLSYPPLNTCITILKTVNVTFACMPGV